MGLEFKLTSNELVDLNLTEPIQSFTDMGKTHFAKYKSILYSFQLFILLILKVYKQAQKVTISQPQLEAKYVRRARLKDFLPAGILKLDLKSSRVSVHEDFH